MGYACTQANHHETGWQQHRVALGGGQPAVGADLPAGTGTTPSG